MQMLTWADFNQTHWLTVLGAQLGHAEERGVGPGAPAVDYVRQVEADSQRARGRKHPDSIVHPLAD